jgi:hypothetical protein
MSPNDTNAICVKCLIKKEKMSLQTIENARLVQAGFNEKWEIRHA